MFDELLDIVKKIISSHLTRVVVFFFLFVLWQFVLLAVFSVWPASAHSSLCDFSFIPLLASAQRPEEVIQRYMEVVAGAPDEVNVSCFFPPSQTSQTNL